MEQILSLLEKNAKLSVEDVAAMIDKPVEEVAQLLDTALQKGYIRGYRTLVDWEALGANTVRAIIELQVKPKKSRGFDEISEIIADFDEVENLMLISGRYDLQLLIKGRTFQEIALFVAKRLSSLDDVLSTATHFVLHTYKKDGAKYVTEEPDERECN